MQGEAGSAPGAARPDGTADGRPSAPAADGASVPDLISQLLRDVLDLLALEGRAAAHVLALLVFFSVAAACFALFACFGLSAIAVVALVRAGYSPAVALALLAAINAALAVASILQVRRLTKSILLGHGREQRLEHAAEGR